MRRAGASSERADAGTVGAAEARRAALPQARAARRSSLVALAYFAVVVAISVWASRRTRTARDFFVAGHGIGLVALTVASVSTSVSGFAFIGGPGLVYTHRTRRDVHRPAGVGHQRLGAWVLAKRMRLLGEVRGLMTVPDAIGARYRSPARAGILAASRSSSAIVGYMATNALAMGYVIDAIFGIGIGVGDLDRDGDHARLLGRRRNPRRDLQRRLPGHADGAWPRLLVFVFVLSVGGGMGGISRAIMRGATRRSSGRGDDDAARRAVVLLRLRRWAR